MIMEPAWNKALVTAIDRTIEFLNDHAVVRTKAVVSGATLRWHGPGKPIPDQT